MPKFEIGIRKKKKENGYYLVVGRFVPENNYEAMIREFIKSKSKKGPCSHHKCEQNKFTTSCYGILVLTKILGSNLSVPSMTKSCSSTSVKMPLPIYMGNEVGGTNLLLKL